MTAILNEIERFDRLSLTWWNKQGPMRPLHVINELRLDYVITQIALHKNRIASHSLYGLRILDVGCGGGLLAEPMARRGALVVGVDASVGNITTARNHASLQGLEIDYRLGETDQVVLASEKFDVVIALEVVEHVSNIPAFLASLTRRLKPGGLLFISTIDRTWKSYLFAIIGAEYVLKVLPRGTHQWSMFVRPDELKAELKTQGLTQKDLRGLHYHPIRHQASWCLDTRVNYIATYTSQHP